MSATRPLYHAGLRPGHWFAVAALVRAGTARVAAWLRHRRERRLLAGLDDHLLRDLGLTRADVAREYDRPFWEAVDYGRLEAPGAARGRAWAAGIKEAVKGRALGCGTQGSWRQRYSKVRAAFLAGLVAGHGGWSLSARARSQRRRAGGLRPSPLPPKSGRIASSCASRARPDRPLPCSSGVESCGSWSAAVRRSRRDGHAWRDRTRGAG